jgi:preprotein translocase subunit SecE
MTSEEIKVPDATALDKVKLWAAVLAAFGGVVGYYVLAGQPNWERWLTVVGGFVLAFALLAWSLYGRTFWQFVLDSRVELRKIVWPNRQETGMTTLVVFGFVVVAGVFFWLLDITLAWATKFLSGQGG